MLRHVEVQSSKSKVALAEGMFQYFYKLSDRYKVPVTTIAILAHEDTCILLEIQNCH